jgi:hypothetical protein
MYVYLTEKLREKCINIQGSKLLIKENKEELKGMSTVQKKGTLSSCEVPWKQRLNRQNSFTTML